MSEDVRVKFRFMVSRAREACAGCECLSHNARSVLRLVEEAIQFLDYNAVEKDRIADSVRELAAPKLRMARQLLIGDLHDDNYGLRVEADRLLWEILNQMDGVVYPFRPHEGE